MDSAGGRDLTGVRDYIARDSELYAGRFVGRILDTVEKLADTLLREP